MEKLTLIPPCLRFQSAGAQICLTEDAGDGGGVPPASGPQQPRDASPRSVTAAPGEGAEAERLPPVPLNEQESITLGY